MPTTRLQQVAQLVRAARTERGWTQTELAERCGVHTQTIGNLERASHQSTPELIAKLEDVLDINLSAASLAGQLVLDMVHAQLDLKMRELGETKGVLLAAATMDFINEWGGGPHLRRRKEDRDGDVPADQARAEERLEGYFRGEQQQQRGSSKASNRESFGDTDASA